MAKVSRLTNQLIESVRITSGERWLSDDDGGRGGGRLAVRVRPDDRRLFYFRYSLAGQRIAIPLGPYARAQQGGYLTLEEARATARRYSAVYRNPETRDVRAHLGLASRSPQSDAGSAQGAVQKECAVRAATVLDVCNSYLEDLKARKAQSARDTASYIRVHIAPTEWASIPANDLTSRQAAQLLRKIIQAGHTTTAIHVRRMLHAAYERAHKVAADPTAASDAIELGVASNPIAGTGSLSHLVHARERPALTAIELGHLWIYLTEGPQRDEAAIRFVRVSMLLGGQRCDQLLRCPLTAVDLDNMDITLYDPKGRRTKPRVHMLPLTPAVFADIRALRQMSKDLANPFLFAGRKKDSHLSSSHVSRSMSVISTTLLAQRKLEQPLLYANLRSTIETRLVALDVQPQVMSQIQSHGISGVQAKHYDKWDYMPQKRAALFKWARFLAECADRARNPNSYANSSRSISARLRLV